MPGSEYSIGGNEGRLQQPGFASSSHLPDKTRTKDLNARHHPVPGPTVVWTVPLGPSPTPHWEAGAKRRERRTMTSTLREALFGSIKAVVVFALAQSWMAIAT